MAKSYLKRRRNDLIYAVLYFLYLLARYIPRRIGLALSGLLGRIVFLFPAKDKTRTIRHLTRVYNKTWSPRRIHRTAAAVYTNAGKSMFDAMCLSQCSDKAFMKIVRHNDLSIIKKAYEKGRGLIGITSHSGCYEMNVHLLARLGFRCVTIGQKVFDKRVDRLIVAMRQRNNITYLHRDKSSREVLRFLKKGGALGVVLDQDTYGEGVFANFLGEPAYTPSGPVRIAMRNTIPLIIAYSARQKDNSYYIYFTGPVELENTGDFNRDLVMNVENINNVLSKGILDFPDQWPWMHRRWLRKPGDEEYKDVPNIEDYQ